MFQNVIKILPTIYQNKSKMSQKIGSALFIYKKWEVLSTICKLFEYNFWYNCLEFSDKMDLTIQMATLNNVNIVYLKFGDRIFTSLTMLELQAKASIYSTIKENLPFILSQVFGICYRRHSLTYLDNKVCLTKNRYL